MEGGEQKVGDTTRNATNMLHIHCFVQCFVGRHVLLDECNLCSWLFSASLQVSRWQNMSSSAWWMSKSSSESRQLVVCDK